MIFWLNCKLREEKLLGWWLPGNETPIIKKRFARWLSINKQSLLYFDLSSLRPGRCSEEQEAAKKQLSVNVVGGNQRRCLPRTSSKRSCSCLEHLTRGGLCLEHLIRGAAAAHQSHPPQLTWLDKATGGGAWHWSDVSLTSKFQQLTTTIVNLLQQIVLSWRSISPIDAFISLSTLNGN